MSRAPIPAGYPPQRPAPITISLRERDRTSASLVGDSARVRGVAARAGGGWSAHRFHGSPRRSPHRIHDGVAAGLRAALPESGAAAPPANQFLLNGLVSARRATEARSGWKVRLTRAGTQKLNVGWSLAGDSKRRPSNTTRSRDTHARTTWRASTHLDCDRARQ